MSFSPIDGMAVPGSTLRGLAVNRVWDKYLFSREMVGFYFEASTNSRETMAGGVVYHCK